MREGGAGVEEGSRGRLRKGTSEEGMDGAKERGQGGGSNGARERRTGDREGNFKGGTLMRSLASIHYTAVITQNNTQRGPYHYATLVLGVL